MKIWQTFDGLGWIEAARAAMLLAGVDAVLSPLSSAAAVNSLSPLSRTAAIDLLPAAATAAIKFPSCCCCCSSLILTAFALFMFKLPIWDWWATLFWPAVCRLVADGVDEFIRVMPFVVVLIDLSLLAAAVAVDDADSLLGCRVGGAAGCWLNWLIWFAESCLVFNFFGLRP